MNRVGVNGYNVLFDSVHHPETTDFAINNGPSFVKMLDGTVDALVIRSCLNRTVLDSLAVSCRFEPAVGGTSEALRVAVLPIREGKCLPGVFAPNGQ